jgi:hypothetical protein
LIWDCTSSPKRRFGAEGGIDQTAENHNIKEGGVRDERTHQALTRPEHDVKLLKLNKTNVNYFFALYDF